MYGFVITTAGEAMLARAAAGETLALDAVTVGRGVVESAAAAKGLSALVVPVAAANSTAPAVAGNQISMTVEYRNDLNGGLETGFALSEFGISAHVGDDPAALLYYGSLGDTPQPVKPTSEGLAVHRFPVAIAVTGEVSVALEYPAGGFLTQEDLGDLNFDPAGSAEAVQGNLDAHIVNKENPHEVTAEQVGAATMDDFVYTVPSGKGRIILKLSTESGMKLSGISVTNNQNTTVAQSTEDGVYVGDFEVGTVTFNFGATIGINTHSAVTVTAKNGEITTVEVNDFTIQESGEFLIDTSQEVFIPSFIDKVDLFGVGGGGAGAKVIGIGSSSTSQKISGAATGGAGGYTTTLLDYNILDHTKPLKITIGAGGISSQTIQTNATYSTQHGGRGGDTTVSYDGSNILTANGGEGGYGVGNKQSGSVNASSSANGASGGSGSGGARVSIGYDASATSDIVLTVGNAGLDGSNGEDGGTTSGGTGQGTTTKEFGDSSKNMYSNAGASAVAGLVKTSTGVSDVGTYASGAGKATAIADNTTTEIDASGGDADRYGCGGGGVVVVRNAQYKVTAIGGFGYKGMVKIRWNLANEVSE